MKLKKQDLWKRDLVEFGPKERSANEELKEMRYFPLIVSWGIWLARNSIYIEGNFVQPIKCALESIGILSHFPQENVKIKFRQVTKEDINKSRPWGYFDGATNGNPKRCGARGLIYFSKNNFLNFKAGLGIGTNTFLN